MSYAQRRLESSTTLINNLNSRSKLMTRSIPLYADLVSTRPETSTVSEIVNGNVMLSIAGFAFGWTATQILFDPTCEVFFGSFEFSMALAAELFAFSKRWMSEKKLQDWEKTLILVKTVESSRPDILGLTVGRDGNLLSVTITTAQRLSRLPRVLLLLWDCFCYVPTQQIPSARESSRGHRQIKQ